MSGAATASRPRPAALPLGDLSPPGPVAAAATRASTLAPARGTVRVLTGSPLDPTDDVGAGPALLRDAVARGHGGWLRVYRPAPTVAFSRRDALHAGFARAVRASTEHGFTPVLRAPGGRAAAYHQGALCIELVVADADASTGSTRRFEELADVLLEVLRSFGVDAQVGAVPDEYCPGRHSVNGAGRVKLAGTAQRVVRGGWFLGGVLLVDGAGPVRDVIAPVYDALGLRCDVATIGSVSELCSGVEIDDVTSVLLAALARRLPLEAAHHPFDLLGRARAAALEHPALERPALEHPALEHPALELPALAGRAKAAPAPTPQPARGEA